MCRCAVCAVSDAECLLGRVPRISHAIPLWVFQLLKSERWNFAVFETLRCPAFRELHAELMGPPCLLHCVSGQVLHQLKERCTG